MESLATEREARPQMTTETHDLSEVQQEKSESFERRIFSSSKPSRIANRSTTNSTTYSMNALLQNFHERWKHALTGEKYDLENYATIDILSALSHTAEHYLKSIRKNASQIWPDLSPIHLSNNFRQCFSRLRTLTIAYSVNGTSLYRDDKTLEIIIDSLDFINSEAYNSSTVVNKEENWWNYKIGSSIPLIDISMLLYDELGWGRTQEYGQTVSRMIGNLDNPSLTGSNRANMCQAIIGAGILIQDSNEVERGRFALFDRNGGGEKSVLSYARNDDGFFEDGSYISHHVYPYVGGYGLTHILAVSQVAYVVHDSPFNISSSDLSIIFLSIRRTFTPFVFRGMIMGSVRGRAISRKDDDDVAAGFKLIEAVQRLIYIAPEPFKSDFDELLVSWRKELFISDTNNSGPSASRGFGRLTRAQNSSVSNFRSGFCILPKSDRVVFHQQNWSASLAMSSVRTGRYETLNSENLRPFYQGDGFLQVYLDNDRRHFLDDYYPTMDPYHTPGVTAGQIPQELASYRSTANNSWAGGVQWRDLGGASLDYLSYDKLVSAKKSWFFLANMIVALGVGCTGQNGTQIHTTIDTRKSQFGTPRLVIDGESYVSSPWRVTYAQPRWAHVEGVGGYHFLDFGTVEFERSKRLGRWTDVNGYPDYAKYSDLISREYTTIYRNHSADAAGKSYAYAVLPNMTDSETARLASAPDFYITANTEVIQGITFHHNRTMMATFWKAGIMQDVEAMTSCQVAWGFASEEDDEYTVSLADPSQKASQIEIWLRNPEIGPILHRDPEIEFAWLDGRGIHLQVDTRDSRGKSYKIVFQRSPRLSTDNRWSLLAMAVIAMTVISIVFICYRWGALQQIISCGIQHVLSIFSDPKHSDYSLLLDEMPSLEE